MSLYSSTDTLKESGASWGPGLYKFKVESAELHSKGNIMMKMLTKTLDDQEGPKVVEWLNITSEKQGAKDEVNRRLQVLLGKTSIDAVTELVGKVGHVVLQKPGKYLEAFPFGGFYDAKKLSATGSDSTAERIEQALKVAPVETVVPLEIEGVDLPF